MPSTIPPSSRCCPSSSATSAMATPPSSPSSSAEAPPSRAPSPGRCTSARTAPTTPGSTRPQTKLLSQTPAAFVLTEPLCSQWPVEPTSDTFNEPVVSDIPALVVAGRYDPITPPDSSQTVAGRLTNSTFALWPDRGHGVAGGACANDIMSAFLDDPSAPVDLACLTSVPDPAFG